MIPLRKTPLLPTEINLMTLVKETSINFVQLKNITIIDG